MSRVVYESEKRIKCHYGNGHNGVDIGWRSDENQNIVYPNCQGTVEEIQDGLGNLPNAGGVKSWGNYVLIHHPNGMYTRYAHLRSGIMVSNGQSVDENTKLGIMGDSGNANGRHLHFEVANGYSSATRINPEPYLTQAVYTAPTPTPQPSGETTYVVQSGDTLSAIGRKYGKTWQELASYNNLSNPNLIHPGDVIRIPNTITQSEVKYTVQSGDTLSSIGRKYGKTWQEIYNKNVSVIGSNPNLIKPGQVLTI